MKKSVLCVACLFIILVSIAASAQNQQLKEEQELKPEQKIRRFTEVRDDAKVIEGLWRIELVPSINKKDVQKIAEEIAKAFDAKVRSVIAHKNMKAFWLEHFFRPEKLAEDSRVREIREGVNIRPQLNGPIPRPMTTTPRTPFYSMTASSIPTDFRTVVSGDYALDRIDTSPRLYDGIYSFFNEGVPANGIPVDIYVLDTGIVQYTSEFGSRATIFRSPVGDTSQDCDGHGTRVSSKVAGATVGASSGVKLLLLKIYNCVTNDYVDPADIEEWLYDVGERATSLRPRGAVFNISFSTYDPLNAYSFLDTALTSLISDDIVVIVATGQSDTATGSIDNAQYWPQRHGSVLRVGMTDNLDRRISTGLNNSYPNGVGCFGLSLPHFRHRTGSMLFAPAGPRLEPHPQTGQLQVVSCGPTTVGLNGGYTPAIGTSYAAPLAAGVAAQFLSTNGGTTFPHYWTVIGALTEMATTGQVTFRASGEPDKLLYNQFAMTTAVNSAGSTYDIAQDSLATVYASFPSAPTSIRLCVNPACNPTYNCPINTGGSSSSQVNFRVPSGLAGEVYSLKAFNGNNLIGYGWLRAFVVAPGVFALNGQGSGPSAAQLWVYLKSDGSFLQYYDIPSAGVAWDPNVVDVYLVIYGTGWRHHNGNNTVQLKKQGGSTIYTNPNHYGIVGIGASSSPGQDQINIGPLPAALVGSGTWEIKVYINNSVSQLGILANVTTVKFN